MVLARTPLLVYRYLGYRVFYVTAASAANIYTFLGDEEEGQGTLDLLAYICNQTNTKSIKQDMLQVGLFLKWIYT